MARNKVTCWVLSLLGTSQTFPRSLPREQAVRDGARQVKVTLPCPPRSELIPGRLLTYSREAGSYSGYSERAAGGDARAAYPYLEISNCLASCQ